jgi:hypothetical protein
VAALVSPVFPRLRDAAIAALAVLSFLNLTERNSAVEDSQSLTSRRIIAERLRATESSDRLVVYGSDKEAKMMSLYYKGPGWQATWSQGTGHDIPAHIQELAILSPKNGAEVLSPPEWHRSRVVNGLGNTRFVSWRRVARRWLE